MQENLAENPNFSSELEDARNVLQSQIVHEDGIVTYGAAGGSLKALKALGLTIKHGGTALSWLLKPFNKKYGVLVKKHSRKISNALAKPEKATKSYLENKLIKAGVPKSDAKTIVYWILIVI